MQKPPAESNFTTVSCPDQCPFVEEACTCGFQCIQPAYLRSDVTVQNGRSPCNNASAETQMRCSVGDMPRSGMEVALGGLQEPPSLNGSGPLWGGGPAASRSTKEGPAANFPLTTTARPGATGCEMPDAGRKKKKMPNASTTRHERCRRSVGASEGLSCVRRSQLNMSLPWSCTWGPGRLVRG